MVEEKLGTNKLEEVLGTFLDVGIQGYKAYADDKKIDLGEGIQLAFKIPAVWGAIKELKPAIAQAKDLDPEELAKMMQFVLSKLEEVVKLSEQAKE